MAALQKLDNPKAETNKSVDAITAIAEVVINHSSAKLTLGEVARIANRAAALLRLKDGDVENASAVAIARKHGLVS